VILLFFSGLALWKPVQLQTLDALFGGYEQARHTHFLGMIILAAFLIVHVSVAFAVKGTITSMFTGRLTEPAAGRRGRR